MDREHSNDKFHEIRIDMLCSQENKSCEARENEALEERPEKRLEASAEGKSFQNFTKAIFLDYVLSMMGTHLNVLRRRICLRIDFKIYFYFLLLEFYRVISGLQHI